MESKISVIIPVYNCEEYIVRCLNSITKQSYRNLEIIVIDDGSTDSSYDLIRSLSTKDRRIKLVHQQNGGVSSARNNGIASATGEYITFVDGDDWLNPNAIQIMADLIATKHVDCVRTNYTYDDGKGDKKINVQKIKNGSYEKNQLASLLYDLLIGKDNCFLVTLLIKRDLLIKNKQTLSTDLRMMEDTVFYCELLSHLKNLYVSSESTYNYFWNQQSASKSPEQLLNNARGTIEASNYIDKIIVEKWHHNYFDISHIHAIHLSLIVSRVITASTGMKTIKKLDLVAYAKNVHKMTGFKELVATSDIYSIPSFHNRYSVLFFVNQKYNRLVLLLLARRVAIRLRKIKNTVLAKR